MNFEKYYSKLPGFIKYNHFIYDFSISLSNKLRSIHKRNNQIESQNALLNILFTHCDIQVKGSLRDFQVTYVELLRFIDNVCSKYEIKYWIDYGTLLGAVRHGGFIPWDDDIDISIMREDYIKLIEVLPIEIKKHPKLMENCGLTLLGGNHENYFKEFKSVYDVDSKQDNFNELKFCFLQIAILKPFIKIDIFPKDYILDNELDVYSKNYAFEKYKFNEKIKNNKCDFFKEIDIEKRKIGQVNSRTNYCANSFDYILLEKPAIFNVNDIFPLEKIKFDNHYFNCPNNVYNHLEAKYGKNYMSIPKIIENHNVLSFIEQQFDSKEELDLSFQKTIEYLREINESYES